MTFVKCKGMKQKDMSSRMAGDGVYDVLGFGYDITEDYLGENSTRLQVIDVKALIRDNGDRFYNPFIGTIDQKIVAGEDAHLSSECDN